MELSRKTKLGVVIALSVAILSLAGNKLAKSIKKKKIEKKEEEDERKIYA